MYSCVTASRTLRNRKLFAGLIWCKPLTVNAFWSSSHCPPPLIIEVLGTGTELVIRERWNTRRSHAVNGEVCQQKVCRKATGQPNVAKVAAEKRCVGRRLRRAKIAPAALPLGRGPYPGNESLGRLAVRGGSRCPPCSLSGRGNGSGFGPRPALLADPRAECVISVGGAGRPG